MSWGIGVCEAKRRQRREEESMRARTQTMWRMRFQKMIRGGYQCMVNGEVVGWRLEADTHMKRLWY